MKFFKKKKEFDPYEESILRTFSKLNKKITPSEIAGYLKIHPNTAKDRILKLAKKGYIKCEREGNRTYCKKGGKELKI